MLQVYDPVGLPPAPAAKERRTLPTLVGAKVGFVWNQYASTRRFWPELEKAVAALYEPASTRRVYKDNTWNIAERDKLGAALAESDYLIVGVGA